MQISLLDTLDEPDCVVPPRTQLYNLQPQEHGTSLHEALTSYLVELANAHCIQPWILIRREIIPLTDLNLEKYSGSFITSYAKTINSFTRYSSQFTSALSVLTGCPDLESATFAAWKDVVDPRGVGLLHKHPRWCPDCLYEWRAAGREPYFPLLWYAHPVTHCIDHERPLVEGCPRCGKTQPFIPKHYYIDHCSHCGQWLGHQDGPHRHSGPTNYERFAGNAVAEMVMEGINKPRYATHARLQMQLKDYVKLVADGSFPLFVRQLGLTAKVIEKWAYKDTRPQLGQLLRLCYRLDTTPVRLLRDPLPEVAPRIAVVCKKTTSKPRIKISAERRKQLRCDLQGLIDNQGEPDTLKVVAAKLGQTVNFLKYWFPHECAEITNNRRRHMQEMLKAYTENAEEVTYNIVMDILKEGQRLNRRVVEKLLHPHKLSLAHPAARAGMHRAQEEFFADYKVAGTNAQA